ncbi:MAG TPA: DUF1707 domain-containing protein [Streptosporangiaceae bacterium]|nr:DUF1707 domain-containing protein [Streptosporangiaceae bacterium]
MLATVGYLQIRASATDRDRIVDVLKSGFIEGRLTKQELDERVGHALGEHYFADLIALIEDLPAGIFARLPAHPATPPHRRTGRVLRQRQSPPRPRPPLRRASGLAAVAHPTRPGWP